MMKSKSMLRSTGRLLTILTKNPAVNGCSDDFRSIPRGGYGFGVIYYNYLNL